MLPPASPLIQRLCMMMGVYGTNANGRMDLHDLLINKLQILYDIENQIVRALPKMAASATDQELKSGFEAHVEETKRQAETLESIFEDLGEKAEQMQSEAIRGMIADSERMMKEIPAGPALDAELAASAQAVEHLEIAGYGSACAWAKQIGKNDIADRLEEILDEEKETDKKLTRMAEAKLNKAATL